MDRVAMKKVVAVYRVSHCCHVRECSFNLHYETGQILLSMHRKFISSLKFAWQPWSCIGICCVIKSASHLQIHPVYFIGLGRTVSFQIFIEHLK